MKHFKTEAILMVVVPVAIVLLAIVGALVLPNLLG